ncbi:aspartokinase 2, chloroplastic-like [Lycium ferocissimum]|uniref:aspartokinase 2, chloroplastic-like n=1 Tax=Lycium ferocissimum TaxID=112874 RepID=UPI002815182F|nr:aspartokinase 2, chloroplastic-like [Lycium ferocissimum]
MTTISNSIFKRSLHFRKLDFVASASGLSKCFAVPAYRARGLARRVICNAQAADIVQLKEAINNEVFYVCVGELTLVMKFGGSSLASSERMKEVVDLILRFCQERPVIVLSAMGKTTNNLLLAGKKAVTCGVYSVAELQELSFVKELHLSCKSCPLS